MARLTPKMTLVVIRAVNRRMASGAQFTRSPAPWEKPAVSKNPLPAESELSVCPMGSPGARLDELCLEGQLQPDGDAVKRECITAGVEVVGMHLLDVTGGGDHVEPD